MAKVGRERRQNGTKMKISLTRFCVPATCRFKGTEDVQNRIGFNRLRGDAVNSLRK